jgi:hypothetical protein
LLILLGLFSLATFISFAQSSLPHYLPDIHNIIQRNVKTGLRLKLEANYSGTEEGKT